MECWGKTENFHIFYRSVKLAHKQYFAKAVKAEEPIYIEDNVVSHDDSMTAIKAKNLLEDYATITGSCNDDISPQLTDTNSTNYSVCRSGDGRNLTGKK